MQSIGFAVNYKETINEFHQDILYSYDKSLTIVINEV